MYYYDYTFYGVKVSHLSEHPVFVPQTYKLTPTCSTVLINHP